MCDMYWPLWFAPIVILAELIQLILAERHIGVRVIKSGEDPRQGRQSPPFVGWLWFGCAALCIAYPGLLVFFGYARFQALTMMLFTVVGFEVRRRSGLRWALVALTIEGAVRIALITQLLVLWAWFGSPALPGLSSRYG